MHGPSLHVNGFYDEKYGKNIENMKWMN